eukprot:TRINITY_DN27015_c0_g1_i1.p1 TRINITY_DN27015_c0_g1~~TRINITY_DN27015_c0_g1_i1.p1  ORF type:complete len:356 (+),score=54.40 TRINITY_DN27015_c0_g1_i1:158-1069(+)
MKWALGRHYGGEDSRKKKGKKPRYLNILDFAAFSGLTNLGADDLESTLQERFPKFRLVLSHRTGLTSLSLNETNGTDEGFTPGQRFQDKDWTTFFEFEDLANTTTIFAVRGTQSILDIMLDMNMWLPSSIIQAYGYAGPVFMRGTSQVIFKLSQSFNAADSRDYFSSLSKRVKEKVTQDPGRRYYFTGHSLGGGLAQLMALETGRVSVTFSSPGLSSTSMRLLSKNRLKDKKVWLEMLNVAGKFNYVVVPEIDVVPKIDKQLGTQIKIPCHKRDPIECHKLTNTHDELEHSCRDVFDFGDPHR